VKKHVTIYEIAKKANTSTATVSRVLSNSDYPVSPELRTKIQKVAKELNYIPNMLGRQLKTNNSMTIGVIIPSITNPFYSSIVLGIEEVARKRGYHVLLCNSHRSPKLEESYLNELVQKQVKGLIISSISQNNKLLLQLGKNGLNFVALDQSVDGLTSSQIHFDYKKAGYLATSYLIAKGHRDIAFVSSPLSRPSRQKVYEGFQEALREHEIDMEENWVQISSSEEEHSNENFEFKNGKLLTSKLLEQDKLPTAIFACNDMTAFGVMKELTEKAIKIPDEISVIGFDNIEFGNIVTPSLTTINQPDHEMGRLACNLLLDQLNGEAAESVDMILQPKIIERNSVAVLKN